MKRPFFLITNDDGVHAPGLVHLCQSVQDYADIAIAAPSREKSGAGLSITWNKPLLIEEVPWEKNFPAWSISGTPADCVKMALNVLLKKKPDLILSGINKGSNAGRTVLYSGTVGGVIEGAFKGIPGIAFSFSDMTPPPLSATQPYLLPIIQYFLSHPLPPETILNVNFPYHAARVIKGLRLAKQGKGYWAEQPEQRTHPEGTPYYWLGGKWLACEEDPDSDIALLEQGYATAVPLHVGQITHFDLLEQHKHPFSAHTESCLGLGGASNPSQPVV